FMGNVEIPWTAVKSLKSDQNLTVILPGGEAVNGKVSTSGAALEVADETGTKSAPLVQVPTIRNPAEQHAWERLQHPSVLALWTGFVDLGLALASGNARTSTFTTAFNASRVTSEDKITVYLNQIRGSARVNGVDSLIASAVRGGWAYSRDINSRLFVSGFND